MMNENKTVGKLQKILSKARNFRYLVLDTYYCRYLSKVTYLAHSFRYSKLRFSKPISVGTFLIEANLWFVYLAPSCEHV